MMKGVTFRLAGLLALGLTVLLVGVADAQGPGGFGKKGKGGFGPGGPGGSGGEIEGLKNDVKALKEQMNRIEGMLKAGAGKGGPGGEEKKGGFGWGKGGFGKGGFGKGDEKGWGKWGGFEKKFGGKEPPMKKDEPRREPPDRGPKGKGPDREGGRGDSREIEQTIDRLIRELENLRRSLRR